jgi:hypothetical protein
MLVAGCAACRRARGQSAVALVQLVIGVGPASSSCGRSRSLTGEVGVRSRHVAVVRRLAATGPMPPTGRSINVSRSPYFRSSSGVIRGVGFVGGSVVWRGISMPLWGRGRRVALRLMLCGRGRPVNDGLRSWLRRALPALSASVVRGRRFRGRGYGPAAVAAMPDSRVLGTGTYGLRRGATSRWIVFGCMGDVRRRVNAWWIF